MGRFAFMDELNKTLLLTGVIAFLARLFLSRVPALYWVFTAVAAAAIVFFVIRLVNISSPKRARENMAFTGAVGKVKNFFSGRDNNGQRRAKVVNSSKNKQSFSDKIKDRMNYRYLYCPQCSQKLRVPKGKGKIRVTCSLCRNQFIAKS